jgi:hypothetical protein
MDKSKDKLKCKNTNCTYNKNGYCTILTQNQALNSRITCEERDW